MNLKNKKILITGATGGIGNSLIKKFYDLGSSVVATGTNEEKLNNLKIRYPKMIVEKFKLEEHEKIEFAHLLENELDGIIMDPEFSRTFDHGYFSYAKLNNPPGNFKDFRILNDSVLHSGNQIVELHGKSIHEMISHGKSINAKYILVDTDNSQSFLDNIFNEKIDTPFLIKIYDTKEQGFNQIDIKIFEIDYSLYDLDN